VAGVVSEPPTKEEVEKERTRILQGMEQRMNNSQQAALGLSETIASGDWRLFFLNYDQIKTVTPEDVVRVAKLYFKESNRTVGEFIPTPEPDRTQVPSSPDLDTVFQSYKSGMTIAQGEAFDPAPANIEKHLIRSKQANGLKVVMLPKTNRGATVIASLDVEFGDEKALAGKNAVGSLAGSLLMRGTKTHTRQQIQDEMVRLNARINVSGGVSGASASVQTTAENLIPAMRLAAEMLREPSFPDAEFEQVKKQRIAGVESRRTEPGPLAQLALARALNTYPRNDVRYVGTLDEDIDDVNKVTLDDVKKFHEQFYGTSHGELVVVGQFDQSAVSKTATDLFGAWTSPAPYQRIITNFQKTAPVNVKIETPDKANAQFEAEMRLPMRDTDPDYPAMVLANYIFGGSITGRVPDRIRNREGLSYSVSTGFSAATDGDAAQFSAGAISNPKNAPKVESSFQDELAQTLAGGFTAAEVAAGKQAWRDARRVGRSQDQQLVRLIATREEYGRTLDWDTQMDAKVEALTVDQINAAFKRHVDPAAISIVKAGDFKAAGVYQ
jgi:zinc protease